MNHLTESFCYLTSDTVGGDVYPLKQILFALRSITYSIVSCITSLLELYHEKRVMS